MILNCEVPTPTDIRATDGCKVQLPQIQDLDGDLFYETNYSKPCEHQNFNYEVVCCVYLAGSSRPVTGSL